MPVTKIRWKNKSRVSERWRADAGIDPITRKRIRKVFATRTAALEWLHDSTARKEDQQQTADAKKSISWLGEKYIAHVRSQGRSRVTWKKYESYFQTYINSCEILDIGRFGDIAIRQLKPSHMIVFLSAIGQDKSRVMVGKIYSTVRAALDFAVANEWRENNPAQAVKIKRERREVRNDVRLLSKEEIGALTDMILTGNEVTLGATLILTLLTTGLRPSEALALHKEDMELGAKPHIHVTRSIDRWREEVLPKSQAGTREIALMTTTANMLRRWIKKGETKGKKNPTKIVFPTGDGSYQNLSNVNNRIWRPIIEMLGWIEDGKARFRLYDLRHTFASIQIDQGMDAKALQRVMGHASIQTTYDLYGHLFRDIDRAQRDAKRLEKFILGERMKAQKGTPKRQNKERT